MMSESSKRHSKFLSLIFILKCLSKASVIKTTISVKIVGTLNCLLTLPMLVYKISLVVSDEQHWEDEETARRIKKQRAIEVSQLFLSETVLEKEFEELLTLSCNSVTGLTQCSVLGCS